MNLEVGFLMTSQNTKADSIDGLLQEKIAEHHDLQSKADYVKKDVEGLVADFYGAIYEIGEGDRIMVAYHGKYVPANLRSFSIPDDLDLIRDRPEIIFNLIKPFGLDRKDRRTVTWLTEKEFKESKEQFNA